MRYERNRHLTLALLHVTNRDIRDISDISDIWDPNIKPPKLMSKSIAAVSPKKILAKYPRYPARGIGRTDLGRRRTGDGPTDGSNWGQDGDWQTDGRERTHT